MQKLDKKKILNRIQNLRGKFWGIEFFFEFLWYYEYNSKYYETIDKDLIYFQKYIKNQYNRFFIQKSKIFDGLYQIWFDFFVTKFGVTETASDLAINNVVNIIKLTKISEKISNGICAADLHKNFDKFFKKELYGISSSEFFTILVEKKILKLENNIYQFYDFGVQRYFEFCSFDVMDFASDEKNHTIRIIEEEIFNLLQLLQDLDKKVGDIDIDFSENEVNLEFSDKNLQEKYEKIMIESMLLNDLLFHKLFLVFVVDGYFCFSENEMQDNLIYIREISRKNENSFN